MYVDTTTTVSTRSRWHHLRHHPSLTLQYYAAINSRVKNRDVGGLSYPLVPTSLVRIVIVYIRFERTKHVYATTTVVVVVTFSRCSDKIVVVLDTAVFHPLKTPFSRPLIRCAVPKPPESTTKTRIASCRHRPFRISRSGVCAFARARPDRAVGRCQRRGLFFLNDTTTSRTISIKIEEFRRIFSSHSYHTQHSRRVVTHVGTPIVSIVCLDIVL